MLRWYISVSQFKQRTRAKCALPQVSKATCSKTSRVGCQCPNHQTTEMRRLHFLISWIYPLPSNSDFFYIAFLVGDPYKPSFATATGGRSNFYIVRWPRPWGLPWPSSWSQSPLLGAHLLQSMGVKKRWFVIKHPCFFVGQFKSDMDRHSSNMILVCY